MMIPARRIRVNQAKDSARPPKRRSQSLLEADDLNPVVCMETPERAAASLPPPAERLPPKAPGAFGCTLDRATKRAPDYLAVKTGLPAASFISPHEARMSSTVALGSGTYSSSSAMSPPLA